MTWNATHELGADRSFDGGDLDCGNGLLLLIRKHIDPLLAGQLLEVRSTDKSVEEDLPAWARLTGNELVSRCKQGEVRSYLLRKAGPSAQLGHAPKPTLATTVLTTRPPAPLAVSALSVLGIGSWPRPGWLLRALHERLTGRLSEDEFQRDADDAVQLAVAAQERAGVDVVTDGEQRRDNYASFVGMKLENCQLIPITDLLPYVTDPEHFAQELRALDVPAEQVRHPAVFGPIARKQSLTGIELARLQSLTAKPTKVALPGPYLLTRTMWLDCIAEKAYPDRESLAKDLVAVLRAEIADLLALGAALVQLDEPVLTEVVFARAKAGRSFMCGALGEKRPLREELDFAQGLLQAVLAGFPRDRLALHLCRGNWSKDESVALTGPYTPLVPLLCAVPVGTYFLEMSTPRAGEWAPLTDLPGDRRIGVGLVNQKLDRVETVEEVLTRVTEAVKLFGPERLLLNPDCGFATFADNPLSSATVAEQKLAVLAQAARVLRAKYA